MYTTTTFIGDNENYPMRNAVKRASVPKDYIHKPVIKPAEFVVINPAPVKEAKKEEEEKKEPEVKETTENISPAPVEEAVKEAPVTEKKARKSRGKKAPTNQAEATEDQQGQTA